MASGWLSRGGWEVAVVGADVPLVVCVSTDRSVRERVVRRLYDCGAVLICADLEELSARRFGRLPGRGSDGREVAPPVVTNIAHLSIDPIAHRVTWQGQPLLLTRLERALLTHLAETPLAVWTYQRLFSAVWGGA